mmetsp:Transcript_44200/g.88325  ORF Transcript_44200/g.88325 Transcript_44200/m.88325 type:complete len:262 (+) Transcript_44200:741-1526(+)
MDLTRLVVFEVGASDSAAAGIDCHLTPDARPQPLGEAVLSISVRVLDDCTLLLVSALAPALAAAELRESGSRSPGVLLAGCLPHMGCSQHSPLYLLALNDNSRPGLHAHKTGSARDTCHVGAHTALLTDIASAGAFVGWVVQLGRFEAILCCGAPAVFRNHIGLPVGDETDDLGHARCLSQYHVQPEASQAHSARRSRLVWFVCRLARAHPGTAGHHSRQHLCFHLRFRADPFVDRPSDTQGRRYKKGSWIRRSRAHHDGF